MAPRTMRIVAGTSVATTQAESRRRRGDMLRIQAAPSTGAAMQKAARFTDVTGTTIANAPPSQHSVSRIAAARGPAATTSITRSGSSAGLIVGAAGVTGRAALRDALGGV